MNSMNKIPIMEPGDRLVSYKVARPHDKQQPKSTRLRLAQLNASKNMMFIGGNPMMPVDDKVYRMNFKTVYPGGFVGFLLLKDDPKRRDREFLAVYRDPSTQDKLRVGKHNQLEENAHLVAYRYCELHCQEEYLRGLVQSPIEEDEVTLFLVDEFEWVKLPRDELYYAQFDTYMQQFMGIVAEFHGVEILQFLPELNVTIERLVTKYIKSKLGIQFLYDDRKDQYKAVVDLLDDHGNPLASFNDLVFKELLKESIIEFPNPGDRGKIRGFISHVSKNGTIYIQPTGTVANALADWLYSKGNDAITDLDEPGSLHYREELQDPVSMSRTYVAPFQEGDGDENAWYRAQIIKQVEDKFTVRFIDYGNTAVVHRSQIYFADQINPYLELNKLPALAFSFHMKFVEEITHVKEVLEFCGDQEVEVDIRVEKAGNLRCALVRDGSRKINEEICVRGWATRAPDPKAPKRQ